MSDVISTISIIIAAVSLYISIKVYRRDTPKLRVEIRNPKYDCFFGDVQTEYNNHISKNRISGVCFWLRNGSSANIEVSNVDLIIQGEIFRLISNDNPYWDTVEFLTFDHEENKVVPDCNYAINYAEFGIKLPCIIKAYSCLSYVALFHDFPAKITHSTYALLKVKTAVGVIQKKFKLYEYNDTFAKQEWEEVEQHFRSIGDK